MFRKSCLLALALGVAAPSAHGQTLRDPTQPYGAAPVREARQAKVEVSAIFVSPTRRVAVVNGKSVTEGERVAGATVSRIAKDSVTLRFDDRTVTARLDKTRIRQ